MGELRLSPSKINAFLDCPRCFWMEHNRGLKKPRGIMSSLPGGIDGLVKTYMDGHRVAGTLPPELKQLKGNYVLYNNQGNLMRWRNWRSGLAYRFEKYDITLSGALDDLLMTPDEKYFAPFDIKTKGKATTREDAVKYYSNQMNCYGLMLDKNGMKISGRAYLLYYHPTKATGDGLTFARQLVELDVDPGAAAENCIKVKQCLESPDSPPLNPGCEYCNYIEMAKGVTA